MVGAVWGPVEEQSCLGWGKRGQELFLEGEISAMRWKEEGPLLNLMATYFFVPQFHSP
jgi:hypothetical protein